MLFVFGFRANKLRQGKLSELIHKSEAYPDLDFCSVDVHFKYNFKNNEFALQEKDTELVVTRTAFKNNTSKYYVNGKESTYTKVTELLKKEGIDLDHKRFLILQGEVESIAQMKPKAEKEGDEGILEYLEDIIGTSKYKAEIETTLQKLEECNEVCVEKDNRLKIVERELHSLEENKNGCLEYLKLERECTILKSNLLQHRKIVLSDSLSDVKAKSILIEKELESGKAAEREISASASSFRDSISKNSKAIAGFETEEKELSETISTLSNKKIAAEENKKNHEQNKEKDKASLESNQRALDSIKKELETCDEEIENAGPRINELKENISKETDIYEEASAELQRKSSHLTQQVASLEQDLEPFEQKIAQLKSDSILKNEEINLLKKRTEKSDETIKLLREKKEAAQVTLLENESLIDKLSSNADNIERSIEEKKKALYYKENSFKTLNDLYLREKQSLMDARNVLSSTENSNKVIKSLFQLQQQGRIKGFHGRLGDLGMVNSKYDVAISTAAPRLNDIVVDTVECAQQCIEYLRVNRLGYARFILLAQLPNFSHSINEKFTFLPKGIFRLFDLVQTADKIFLPAFYSVLRDTIVANNLNEANKIAYGGHKRYRVVTLDGKLIDISGTMSGGGRQKAKGLIRVINNHSNDNVNIENLFVTSEQIKNMEQKFKLTEEEYESTVLEITQQKDAIDKIQNSLPDIKIKISSLKFETTNLESEISSYNSQLKQLEQTEAQNKLTNSAQIESLLLNVEACNTEILSIMDSTKSKTSKIDSLKVEIDQLGGFKLNEKKKEIDSMESELQKVIKDVKKKKTTMKKKENELERTKKTILKLSKSLENFETDLLEYDAVISKYSSKISELETKKEALVQSIDELKKQNDGLEAESSDIEQKLIACSKLNKELNKKLEDSAIETEQLVKKINHQDSLLKELKIRDVYESLKVLESLPTKDGSIGVEDGEPADIDMDEEDHGSDNLNSEGDTSDKMDVELEDDAGKESDGNDVSVRAEPELNLQIPSKNFLSHIEYLSLPTFSIDESSETNEEVLEEHIEAKQRHLDSLQINLLALEDYVSKFKSFKQRDQDLKQAVAIRDGVKEKSEQLRKQRFDEFMLGFNIISQSLKEMYQMITMGGNAELELVDSIDPFSEGILFSVMPPKKSWRNISNLSGGEKTLSSLALVFALHNYKPTPIYIMDEIDAALDFKNVSIVANYIKDRTKDAQFIVISLRNNMFELSERLVGIYKNRNMTKSTTLENVDFIHS